MTEIRTHYLDASAIVKLLVDEDGCEEVRNYFYKPEHSIFYTTELCFGETLGALKTKSLKAFFFFFEYLSACYELMAHIAGESIIIDDTSIKDREIYSEVDKIAESYSLDIADAFQIVTLKKGYFSVFTGDAKPILITADKDLAAAGRMEKLRVWDCLREPVP